MADSVTLSTEKREGRGSRRAAKLRDKGRIPGIVYGHKEQPLQISVEKKPLQTAIQHNVRVVDLQGAAASKAQIVEVQWDYLGQEVLHVDFKRISADERIKIQVRIELKGHAPGVGEGAVLDQPLHTLHIECPAIAVPDSIKVSVAELQKGAAIHVRELKLPEGVTVLDDPDQVIVQVTEPKVEAEAPAEAATTAEPELIGRAKGEEEGEGE